jgi:hypothetical protein
VKQKIPPTIHLFRCPTCQGATQTPQLECPNCQQIKKLPTQQELTWDQLPDSGKEAILFLLTKDKPTTVSRTNGGGSMMSLLRRGLVRKAGNRNGQTLWELTEKIKDFDIPQNPCSNKAPLSL